MSFSLFKVDAVWHYRFQIASKRVQRSTRETSRRRASAIAQKAYDDARLWAVGSVPIPTLRELIRQWLAVNRPIVSQAHIRSVETFNRLHLYDLGDLPVSAITTEVVELARNSHAVNHAPASVNQWMRILKLIGNWAVKRDVIPHLPWRVRMLKVQKRPRTTLATTTAKTWFCAIDAKTAGHPAVGTAIRMMFGLGLRESEATGARWEWIDWERRTYTPGVTKGREAEPVPMPDWLVAHLQPLRADAGLIVRTRSGKRYAPGFSRPVMKAANKAIGIDGLTPHRLRGTFATLLSESGVPIQTIQKVMRHKSPMTTMAYLEKNLDMAVAAQSRIANKIGF